MSTMTQGSGKDSLEQLQALGFSDEADYATHQQMQARRAAMSKDHVLLVADGPWSLLQR